MPADVQSCHKDSCLLGQFHTKSKTANWFVGERLGCIGSPSTNYMLLCGGYVSSSSPADGCLCCQHNGCTDEKSEKRQPQCLNSLHVYSQEAEDA